MDNFDEIIKYDGGISVESEEEPYTASSDEDKTYIPPAQSSPKQKRKKSVGVGVRRKKKKKKVLTNDVVEIGEQSRDMFEGSQSDGQKSLKSVEIGSEAKTERICKDAKIKLAGLIKLEECIWNSQEKLHSNVNAVNAAWTRVATEMKYSGKDIYRIFAVFLAVFIGLFNFSERMQNIVEESEGLTSLPQ